MPSRYALPQQASQGPGGWLLFGRAGRRPGAAETPGLVLSSYDCSNASTISGSSFVTPFCVQVSIAESV